VARLAELAQVTALAVAVEPVPPSPRPLTTNALDPGFHCVRAHWIRDFMTFQLARRARTMMLMVSA
jgi:hypothetical protein